MGTRLIDLLKESGVGLLNVDKQQSHFFPDITVIGDVRDKERLTELLKGTDVVVLLAAEHRDDVTPVTKYYDVNVGGMQNTLSAMEANGVRRIVFTSSVAVYGLTRRIRMRSMRKTRSIIMGRASGWRKWSWRNGIKTIRIGISIFCVQQ